ncbi:hypothetical protein [Bacillus sp. FJAT-49736]|uniref:VOC family protein n=1 Tax=Bacillus sp. FJAT-49736 TaxID=2833582 RepID=UPI0020163EA4|nr:hypothetical protein [Bacillus sp. FJAT-49736]
MTLVRTAEDEIRNKKSLVTFNFFTPNIEKAHEHLVNNEVDIEPIHDEGDVKWFKFKGLEGNPLEVCHFKE